MTYYSPVAPVEVLIQMKERGFLEPYLLLLAHEVVEQPNKYKQLLHDFEGTIILDNSLIELGKPVEVDTMLTAAAIVEPNFVVLPDKLLDKDETVRLSVEAIRSWTRKLPEKTNYMVAAQGNTAEEATWCVSEIAKETFTKSLLVGVPRAVANTHGTRAAHVQAITAAGFDVHLLGMSEYLWDDVACAKMARVRGIDSASPLRAGWEGKRYTGKTLELRPRNEYFEKCRGFTIDMAYNVGMINGLIGGVR